MKYIIWIGYLIIGICLLGAISTYFGLTLLGEWNALFSIAALIGLLLIDLLKHKQAESE